MSHLLNGSNSTSHGFCGEKRGSKWEHSVICKELHRCCLLVKKCMLIQGLPIFYFLQKVFSVPSVPFSEIWSSVSFSLLSHFAPLWWTHILVLSSPSLPVAKERLYFARFSTLSRENPRIKDFGMLMIDQRTWASDSHSLMIDQHTKTRVLLELSFICKGRENWSWEDSTFCFNKSSLQGTVSYVM